MRTVGPPRTCPQTSRAIHVGHDAGGVTQLPCVDEQPVGRTDARYTSGSMAEAHGSEGCPTPVVSNAELVAACVGDDSSWKSPQDRE